MIENIPFQEIADSMTDIQKKLFITLLTPPVFNADNNAFLVGCSEETMRWKYYEYSGLWFNEKIIRETLSEIMLPGKKDRYSTFIPTDFTSKATMGPIKTNTFIQAIERECDELFGKSNFKHKTLKELAQMNKDKKLTK